MFVGAYWSQRKESKESASERVATFLSALAKQAAGLSNWYRKGSSRAAAERSPLALDATTIARELTSNRRDDNHKPILGLGFQFSAWNGATASFSVTIGVYSPSARNAAVLNLGAREDLGDDLYRLILEEMIRVFDPDHAVVTSRERLTKARTSNPWDAGRFTYHRGTPIEEHLLE